MSKQIKALKLAREWINANGSYDRAAAILTVIDLALADSALERMAENERELGMQMEPARQQETLEWLTGCPECGMDGDCDCNTLTEQPARHKGCA